MINLIKIEFKKIVPYRTFWVITGIYLVLMPLIFYGVGQLEVEGLPVDFKDVFRFPNVWHNLAYLASWFNLLLGLVVIILVCNEFTYKTWRQHVIDGLSRLEVLLTKLYTIIVLCLVSMLYIFLIGLLFGTIYTEEVTTEVMFSGIHYLLVYFVQAFGYMTVALVVGIIIRRSALSIILFIFSIFIEWLLRGFIPDHVDKYFPMKIISNLTPFPIDESALVQMATQGQGPMPEVGMTLTENVLIAVGYIIAFMLLSFWLLRRRDM